MFCMCSVAVRGHLFLSSYLAMLHWPTFILYVLCFFADITNLYAIYTWFLFVDRIPDRDYHFESLLPDDFKFPLWGVLWLWKVELLTLLVIFAGIGTVVVQTINGCRLRCRGGGDESSPHNSFLMQFCFFLTSVVLLVPALLLLEVVKFSLLFTVVCADRDRQLDAMQPFIKKMVAFFRRGSPSELRTKVWIANRFLARVFLIKHKRRDQQQHKSLVPRNRKTALLAAAPGAIASAQAFLALDPRNFRLEDLLEENKFSVRHVLVDSGLKIAQFFKLTNDPAKRRPADRISAWFHRIVLVVGAPIYVSGLIYTILLPFLALGTVTWQLASIIQSLTSVLYLVTILLILGLSPFAYRFKKYVAYIKLYPTGPVPRVEWVDEIENIYHSRASRSTTYEMLVRPNPNRAPQPAQHHHLHHFQQVTTIVVAPNSPKNGGTPRGVAVTTNANGSSSIVVFGAGLPPEVASIVLEYLPGFDEKRRHHMRSTESLTRELYQPEPHEVATRGLSMAYNERIAAQVKAIQTGELQLVDDAECYVIQQTSKQPDTERSRTADSSAHCSTSGKPTAVPLVAGAGLMLVPTHGGLTTAAAIAAVSRSASARNSVNAKPPQPTIAATPCTAPPATSGGAVGTGTLLLNHPAVWTIPQYQRYRPTAGALPFLPPPALNSLTALAIADSNAAGSGAASGDGSSPRLTASTAAMMTATTDGSSPVPAASTTSPSPATTDSSGGSPRYVASTLIAADPVADASANGSRSRNGSVRSSPAGSAVPAPMIMITPGAAAAGGGVPQYYTDCDYGTNTPIASRTPSVSVTRAQHANASSGDSLTRSGAIELAAALNAALANAPPLLVHPDDHKCDIIARAANSNRQSTPQHDAAPVIVIETAPLERS